jgi:hypothetical protein
MERQLLVARSLHSTERAASEQQQLIGAINMIDFILGGALDAEVETLLDLPASPPTPPADYMRSRERDEREQ